MTCVFCACSVVHHKGVQLVTDTVSYELLKGAVVDYTTDLIRASFEVSSATHLSTKHLHVIYIPCSPHCILDRQPLLLQLLIICAICRSRKIPMPLVNVAVEPLLSLRCDIPTVQHRDCCGVMLLRN